MSDSDYQLTTASGEGPGLIVRETEMKRLALLFALSCLIIVVFCVTRTNNEVRPAVSVSVRICEGTFLVDNPETEFSRSSLAAPIPVRSNTNISIEFTSCDYVYVVKQVGADHSAVVLPGSTAIMFLTLATGTREIELLQGCGQLFASHKQQLVLTAVDSY